MDWRSAEFLKSAPRVGDAPPLAKAEIAFFGRSNVGKSTLINSLTGKRLAFSSKKAGKTMFLNYYSVEGKYYLVDTPGYGYTAYGRREDVSFSEMMEGYFDSGRLSLGVLLVDSRRGMGQEEKDLLSLMEEDGIPSLVVFTKADKLNQKEKAAREKERLALENTGTAAVYGYLDGREIESLRGLIARLAKEKR